MRRLDLGLAGAAAILIASAFSCATSAPEEPDAGAADAGPKDGAVTCTAPRVACSGTCVDPTKDRDNCGGCGKKCTVNQFCAAGKCSDACTSPLVLCGQFCVDLTTDHENCGSCGKQCSADQECLQKTCIKKCPAGLTPCNDQCVNLTNDHENCGSCGSACGGSETCTGGICCASGLVACAGQCTDLRYSSDNCGQCGNACGGMTPYCVGGICSTCNPTVLLVMDNSNNDNQKLVQDLAGAGLPATLVNNGIENYSGSPPAASFGAILVSGGNDLFPNNDMPSGGQTAIVNAQKAGRGVVLVEPLQFSVVYNGYLGTLKQIFLETGSNDTEAYDQYPSLTMIQNHPIWNGITAPMSLNPVEDIYGAQGQMAGGTTVLARCSASYQYNSMCTVDGTILVKTGNGGPQVHINASITNSDYGWSASASIRKMLVNAVGWATACK